MRLRAPNVLVIDDDEDTLDLLRMALQRSSFRVATAKTWEDVAAQIEMTYSQNRPIDVIVLDLMMPDRSGFDILEALKVVLVPLPPVIMLSAVTGMAQQIKARDLGAVSYLTKPTTPKKLIDTIHKVWIKTKEEPEK
jgi:DNA-binding response OmpR family regulator